MSPTANCVPKNTAISADTTDSLLLSRAVTEAGDIALRYYRNNAKHWYKGPGQIVTEADIEVDRCLHDILISARPDDAWLSEECDDDGSRHRCRRVWIVDPIDGTRSFAEGKPEFTISIALVEEGRPVLASIFNPVTEEHFSAAAGEGATLNHHPLRPSKQASLTDASLLASKSEMKKRNWPEFMPDAKFKTIGSLAYKLALVADGRHDGLVSLRPSNDWDLAAAILLIEEAGGWLGDSSGQMLKLNGPTLRHDGLVAAGSEILYTKLISCLEIVRTSSEQR